jgi:hypothetical protein
MKRIVRGYFAVGAIQVLAAAAFAAPQPTGPHYAPATTVSPT